jgi:phosphomevalonate kinase
MTVSVPGNLLFLGEYAVLEEDGLGLACAVDRRVRIETSPGEALRVDASWPGSAFSWTTRDPGASPLVTAVVDGVSGWLRDNNCPPPRWSARIAVDSAELFWPDGRKRGLGASAAVCVGLAAVLLAEAGQRGESAREAITRLATRAHRAAQGGRGSGYDVFCSFHGAMGVFRGGTYPSWQPCRLPWDARVVLFPGPCAVSTTDSVQRYARWKERNPKEARQFLEDSNRSVLAFLRAPSAEIAVGRLLACCRLGIAVGDAIGVPARIDAPAGLDPSWCKALGAGSELGACIIPADRAPQAGGNGFESATVSEKGIAWEE